jgi:hypothetical protein
MPLTSKGEEIKSAMQDQYGKEKGEQVLYASANKGTISGIDAMDAEQQRDESGRFGSGGGSASPPAGKGPEGGGGSTTSKSLKSVLQMGEERYQASSQRATQEGYPRPWAKRATESKSPDGAQDEPPPQKMLPDQQQPNTVPGNESPQAATAISPNMIWPGRHV